jgi:hypothetical protein
MSGTVALESGLYLHLDTPRITRTETTKEYNSSYSEKNRANTPADLIW